jgi:hypothetical protein
MFCRVRESLDTVCWASDTIAGRSRSLPPSPLLSLVWKRDIVPHEIVGLVSAVAQSAFQRQLDNRFAAFSFGAIVQRNTSTVGFGDLPAQS